LSGQSVDAKVGHNLIIDDVKCWRDFGSIILIDRLLTIAWSVPVLLSLPVWSSRSYAAEKKNPTTIVWRTRCQADLVIANWRKECWGWRWEYQYEANNWISILVFADS